MNDKSVDGVLGTRTQGSRMEGPDESICLLIIFASAISQIKQQHGRRQQSVP